MNGEISPPENPWFPANELAQQIFLSGKSRRPGENFVWSRIPPFSPFFWRRQRKLLSPWIFSHGNLDRGREGGKVLFVAKPLFLCTLLFKGRTVVLYLPNFFGSKNVSPIVVWNPDFFSKPPFFSSFGDKKSWVLEERSNSSLALFWPEAKGAI